MYSTQIISPRGGLPLDPQSGHPIQNAGCSTPYEGIIASANDESVGKTYFQFQAGIDALLFPESNLRSVIDIRNVSQIAVLLGYSKGDSTSILFGIEFYTNVVNEVVANAISDSIISYASGAGSFFTRTFSFSATVKRLFTFPNPCMPYMRVYSTITGAATGSQADLSVFRGWGNHNMVQV